MPDDNATSETTLAEAFGRWCMFMIAVLIIGAILNIAHAWGILHG